MYAIDRETCLRELAYHEALIARIEARGVSTQAQRDALATAQVRVREERDALTLLDRLEAR